MPVSTSRARTTTDVPDDRLRPYAHHGVHLTTRGGHAVGDCPFCGREGKFSVAVDSGLWRCLVCGTGTDKGGGNALVFIRLLFEQSHKLSVHRAEIAADRKLLDPETVSAWGVCTSGRTWLVAGYGTDGRLDQLYRRIWVRDAAKPRGGAWVLMPTPGLWPDGMSHALHLPAGTHDATKPNIYIAEGPWDGMALWEVMRTTKRVDGQLLEATGAESASLLADTNVVAVPGCNVWRDEWTAMCRGKHVTLFFDSDHPRSINGRTFRAGFDGTYRVAKKLSGVAASVRWLRWGKEGYDADKPSGWDVRDALSGADDRRASLAELLAKVEDAPADWFAGGTNGGTNGVSHHTAGFSDVEPQRCESWATCEWAWIEALEWRGDLSDVMAVMLAVATSTIQSGDNQLFFQVIGDPGSAKTRLCKGLLVSRHCKLILHVKSFHSGFKVPGDAEKDCSLVARINGLCLVTPEADALMLGMSYDQLNSQMRQIFDGETQNTYGNNDEDRGYKGLRTPWIQAGTPALMDKDQSRLGDRFMRIRIEEPDEVMKRSIMLKALRNERIAVLESSNGTESSIISPKLRKAYALTGGYVDWLRANVEQLICNVDMNERAELRCIDFAVLTADLRARPNMDPKKHEVHHSKELPTRLASQFCRLALCLAVVLNKRSVDADVLRIVRKVALDTAHGHSLNIVRWLCSPNPKAGGRMYQECGGLMVETLAMWSGMTAERLHNYLMFLRKIGVLEWRGVKQTSGAWLLVERVFDLYLRVMGE